MAAELRIENPGFSRALDVQADEHDASILWFIAAGEDEPLDCVEVEEPSEASDVLMLSDADMRIWQQLWPKAIAIRNKVDPRYRRRAPRTFSRHTARTPRATRRRASRTTARASTSSSASSDPEPAPAQCAARLVQVERLLEREASDRRVLSDQLRALGAQLAARAWRERRAA